MFKEKKIIEQELLDAYLDAKSKAAVLLSDDGFTIGSHTFDKDTSWMIENIGMSLASLWHTEDIEFDEITGSTNLGSFAFKKTEKAGKTYFLLKIQEKE